MSEERKENIQTGNPLGEASVASLMVKFADFPAPENQ